MRKIVLTGILALTCFGISQAAIPASERDALIALYYSTNGANSTDRTNSGDTDLNDVGTECAQFAATCDGIETMMIELVHWREGLQGTIPNSIKGLSGLDFMALDENATFGQ